MKHHIVCTAAGVVGGIVATLFGGWTTGLTALVLMMAIDYFSGLVVAGVFHKSPKSPNGGLESKAGLKGLGRKIFILALVAVAHLVDVLLLSSLGIDFVRDAATIGFCANEAISIMENAGLMGIPLPKVLRKAIDLLRAKAEDEIPKEEKPPDEKTSKEQEENNSG